MSNNTADEAYEQGFNDAIQRLRELANAHAVAQYGEEGAQVSMLILTIIEEILREESNYISGSSH